MRQITLLALSGLLIASMVLASGVTPAYAVNHSQVDTETPTPTLTESPTITPTNTTAPTATTAPTSTNTPEPTPDTTRALILATYSLPSKGVVPGKDFRLTLELSNQGGKNAYNIIVTIQGDKLIPRENGGVQAVSQINAGEGKTIKQTLYATPDLAGQETVTITINVAYTDDSGIAYSTPLVLLINLKNPQPTAAYSGPAAPTKTATAAPSSKLIVDSYKTDLEKLQAGNMFTLTLDIQNLGNAAARDVTMVLGGASITGGGDGTPTSGGVSGGDADLSKFAPMGSSNLYYLGDIAPAASREQTLDLVVNVATDPGVYPLKISFVYEDQDGESLVDDQVITLLVYSLPQITVGFYDTVPDIGVGEFRPLPIQITNTGKKATILGEVAIKSSSGALTKNTATAGTIDTGGYFTMDPEFIPDTPGEVTLTIQIKYTDDFQHAGLIEKTLTVNVIESAMPPDGGGGKDGGGGEVPPPVQEESFLDSVLKALLGFLGLAGG